jgi:type VI protein secretion system component VasK
MGCTARIAAIGRQGFKVIGWILSLWTGLGLRARLAAIAVTSAVLALGYLWLRWKLASRRAATAEAKAEALEQTRALEQRIAAARAKTREKQDKLRADIRARGKNDYFER